MQWGFFANQGVTAICAIGHIHSHRFRLESEWHHAPLAHFLLVDVTARELRLGADDRPSLRAILRPKTEWRSAGHVRHTRFVPRRALLGRNQQSARNRRCDQLLARRIDGQYSSRSACLPASGMELRLELVRRPPNRSD